MFVYIVFLGKWSPAYYTSAIQHILKRLSKQLVLEVLIKEACFLLGINLAKILMEWLYDIQPFVIVILLHKLQIDRLLLVFFQNTLIISYCFACMLLLLSPASCRCCDVRYWSLNFNLWIFMMLESAETRNFSSSW